MTDPAGITPGNPAAGSTTIKVDAGRFLWVVFLGCVIVEVALVYLDLTVNWWKWSETGSIRRLFNTTREDALASWFQVSQTLLTALVAWLIFTVLRVGRCESLRWTGWLVIALFFTYLCLDDGAAVHERLGTAFRENAGIGGFPSYAWQLLLMPFFALMGVFVMYFLWREMPRWRDRLKVAAAIACFALAVAMDFVEGLDGGHDGLAAAMQWRPATVRHFSKSIEEFLEMLGMSIFLVTFLGHLAVTTPRLVLEFRSRP